MPDIDIASPGASAAALGLALIAACGLNTYNVKHYGGGAVGDGVTDDQAAFLATYNAAKLVKGEVIIPPGHYRFGSKLTLTGADQGATFVGTGWNDNLNESPEVGGVRLELLDGVNDSLFDVEDDCAPIHWRNIYFRGNQAGQTSGTSHAINFLDSATAARSGTIHNCRFERWRSGAIRFGNNRNSFKVDLCVIETNGFDNAGQPVSPSGGDGITLHSCSDGRITRVDCGENSRHGIYNVGAGSLSLGIVNLYANGINGLAVGIDAQGMDWTDGSCDRNQEDGVSIVGSNTTTKIFARKFTGVVCTGNGTAADDTHADIVVTDDPLGTTILSRVTFSRGTASSNHPKHCIEIVGTSIVRMVDEIPYRTDANAPYVTSFTNAESKLYRRRSGRYTPTLTGVANLSASPTPLECKWWQDDDMVRVSGRATLDPTTADVSTQVGVSLPVDSDFSSQGDCTGTCAAAGAKSQSGAVIGDTTNNRAQIQYIAVVDTSQVMSFEFSYQIK